MQFLPDRRRSSLALSMAALLSIAEGACIPSALPVSGDTTLMNLGAAATSAVALMPQAVALEHAVFVTTTSAGAAAGTPKSLAPSSSAKAVQTSSTPAKVTPSSSLAVAPKASSSSALAVAKPTTSAAGRVPIVNAPVPTTTTQAAGRAPLVATKPATTTSSSSTKSVASARATLSPAVHKRHEEAPNRHTAAGRAILQRRAEEAYQKAQEAELKSIPTSLRFSTKAAFVQEVVTKAKFASSAALTEVQGLLSNIAFSKHDSGKASLKRQEAPVIARLQFGLNSADAVTV